MRKTPPKSVDFADFTPDEGAAAPVEHLDRQSLAGFAPGEAAKRLMDFCASRKSIREITRGQKEMVLKTVLHALAKKGKDAASMDAHTLATYREYLRRLVQNGEISESYASHIVKAWNSVMRLAFGEEGKPGDSLCMIGFPMRARKVQRYDEEDLAALATGASQHRFKSPVDKDAYETYLEIAQCTGARIGSLVYVVKGKLLDEATFGDIDWDKGTIRLRHMKNRPEHEAVLTQRALARLKQREEFLRANGLWRGRETPLLLGSSGKSLTPNGVNRMLKSSAAKAGILKPVSTHVLRKSVGTHIGRHNPRYAAEQLGITTRVFEQHYNQPTVEDRLTRRDILPGHEWQPTTPEEMVGRAWLERSRGSISETEFRAALQRAEQLRMLPAARVPETSPYL